jgi:hypothetical protein
MKADLELPTYDTSREKRSDWGKGIGGTNQPSELVLGVYKEHLTRNHFIRHHQE